MLDRFKTGIIKDNTRGKAVHGSRFTTPFHGDDSSERGTRIRDGALFKLFPFTVSLFLLQIQNTHYGSAVFRSNKKMHFFAHHLADHLDTLPPCYLKHGVKLVDPSSLTDLPPNTLINVHVRVVGGKGGFGSLLRAIGSQIERTTDQNSKRFYFIVQLDKITRVKKSRRSTPARYRTREDGRRATQTEN